MSLSPKQLNLIETSFEALAPGADELVSRFYDNLFKAAPQVREMFPDDMGEQKKKLVASLALVVQNIRKPDALRSPLEEMGRRHAEYGAQNDHYPVVRDVLIATMADVAGDLWNNDLEDAWTTALNLVAGTMIAGAQASQRKAA